MNFRFLTTLSLIASSALLMTGCGDNSSYETPSAADAVVNEGTISQKHLAIFPTVYTVEALDASSNVIDVSLTINIQVSDRNNQLLTNPHTIYFKTEWGVIEPSCTTNNSTCAITWRSSDGLTNIISTPIPADGLVTITAYSIGEENFNDSNDNGTLDDNDQPFPSSGNLFDDSKEPFVDANRDDRDGVYNINDGDIMIDVMAGNVLGKNGAHDLGDGFLNSPNCTHNSLCSTVSSTIYIWNDIEISLTAAAAAP